MALAQVSWDPPSMIIALAVVVVAILILRFVVKTTFSVVKIALLVLIGVGAYLGLQSVLAG